jgi:8-oxo-dGTP pyrophosphatase MutT (NUDIX family)
MIEALTDVRITLDPAGWPLTDGDRARVADHWAAALAANPRLWNGRVLGTLAPGRPGGIAVAGGVLTASAVEGDFAAFIAWRDWGFPEIGIRNLFGSAAILSADGCLLYGVMGGHTANAGRIYPPGGSLEPRDVTADGRVDVLRSIALELGEETGLDPADAEAGPLLALFDGPRVSIARVFRFAHPAESLAARVRAFLSTDPDPELADVAVIRAGDRLDPDRVPPYAAMLAARLLG